jgi:3-deoxy-D-manno-octulosonate 8-phosphate phosphatase (KDO 8-P phosphatase)
VIDRTRAGALRLLALDVDGVLTDGRLYYGNDGEELKAFNIKDGLGLKLLQQAGVAVAIITGRRSRIVERRATELGIAHVVQGREDKRVALEELCASLGLELAQCAYMGDDLPDLGALCAAAIGLAPADAVDAVAAAADWQSRYPGGGGCVREACEQLLHAMDRREAIEAAYR